MKVKEPEEKLYIDGVGEVRTFRVFSGVTLSFLNINVSNCEEIYEKESDVIEINHCCKGRFECEFENGAFYYMAEGNLSVSRQSIAKKYHCFPLDVYKGILILINLKETDNELNAMLGHFIDDPENLKRKLNSICPCKIFKNYSCLSHLFDEVYHAENYPDCIYLKLKIIELFFLLNKYEMPDMTVYKKFDRENIEKMKHIRDYLEENIEEELTLEKLAKKYDVNETEIKRCFSVLYGKSPAMYRREYKIQMASKLLLETDDTIADIAIRVGYQNPSKFSMAFRRIFHMSPSDYRKRK